MGFWATIGKLAIKIGASELTDYARGRLRRKETQARLDDHAVEDAQFAALQRRRERRQERQERHQRAKASR